MLSAYGFPFLLAALVSYILTPYIKKLAFIIGAIDKPDNRKVHKKIMPRLGGLAIYIAFMIAAVASLELTKDIVGILVGGSVIVIVGVLDDKYQLPAKVKLLGQIFAACVLVAFDIRIEWLNNPFGGYFYLNEWILSAILTVFWVISFTNVVNLIDGLDGLAAGVSAIASVTVILVAVQMGYYHIAVMTAALAGGIIGFLRYNFNPASIFHGRYGQYVYWLYISGNFCLRCRKDGCDSSFDCAGDCTWPADYGYGVCYYAPLQQWPSDFPAGQRSFASPSAGDGHEPEAGCIAYVWHYCYFGYCCGAVGRVRRLLCSADYCRDYYSCCCWC